MWGVESRRLQRHADEHRDQLVGVEQVVDQLCSCAVGRRGNMRQAACQDSELQRQANDQLFWADNQLFQPTERQGGI